MFEGLVRQLLLGYLGRYIKDIQKEQLKITVWNGEFITFCYAEEVLLENVELILEAFDYLQLPFALNQGRVGRLSIKIPWKKLGWDPIIITIEDVFVCACQRDDQEWFRDAVERREFAGKKAKLAAAELAKLSRRVCDSQAGESFISYISAKILEGIQVSIRNVHVLYRDMLIDTLRLVLELRQRFAIQKEWCGDVYAFGKLRGGQVHKMVEIHGLEVYCSTFQRTPDSMIVDLTGNSELWGNAWCEGRKNVYVLAPVDVSMSLMVSRSGKHESDAPQYSINVELLRLVLSLDEVQLQQILTLWDYLGTCQLREKYGRYRPWNYPLSSKCQGWQTAWWHYAQQSILSDVRKSLKRTSWKYLGERLIARSALCHVLYMEKETDNEHESEYCKLTLCSASFICSVRSRRRKYVNLYKTKLKCLREEQLVDDNILFGLEQMEKESDIEDILSYRSTAENELQEFVLNSNSCLEVSGASIVSEKSHNDERSSSRPRGWLNWLSRGMLGAGGTDDSSQFSGAVSDDVIKDIYEATKFQPAALLDGTSAGVDYVVFSEIKFNIHQASATLWSMNFGRAVAELIFEGMFIECKLWDESAVITCLVNSGRMINPCTKQDILRIRKYHGGFLLVTWLTSADSIHLAEASYTYKGTIRLSRGLWCANGSGTGSGCGWGGLVEVGKRSSSVGGGPPGGIDSCNDGDGGDISIQNFILQVNGGIFIDGFILFQDVSEMDALETEETSGTIHVGISSVKGDAELLVKVMIQPVEVTYDSEFLLNVMVFCNVLETIKFQPERVILSLNGIEDVRARLLSKSEYILSSRKRVVWDVHFANVRMNIPWKDANYEPYIMNILFFLLYTSYSILRERKTESYKEVFLKAIAFALLSAPEVLEMGSLSFGSKCDLGSASGIEDRMHVPKNFNSSFFTSGISIEMPLEDLYDQFEIKVDDFAVYITMPSLHAHFSPSMYGAVLGLLPSLDVLRSESDSAILPNIKPDSIILRNSFGIMSSKLTTPKAFCFSVIAYLESVNLHIDLENNEDNHCSLLVNLHELDISLADLFLAVSLLRYAVMEMQECWISTKAVKIISSLLDSDKDGHILCSSGNIIPVDYAQQQDASQRENSSGKSTSADGCFVLRLLVEFSDKLLHYGTSLNVENPVSRSMNGENMSPNLLLASKDLASQTFLKLSSLIHALPDWRKILKVRDRRTNSPKVSLRGSAMSFASELKCGFGNHMVSTAQYSDVSDVLIDLSLSRIRDLSLSLFLLNNDGFDASMVDPNNGQVCITFITPFSADVWVRIPDEKGSSCVSSFASTCVMARVDNVQLIAKDGHIVLGFEALLDIIDQFSSVDRQSEGFTSDVLQFLQFKRSIMENRASQPEASTVTLIETKCCVNALSISFYHSRSDVVSMELVARADMQFLLSASFKNEIPIFLDVSFQSLSLFSHLNSVMLGKCTSSCPTSSVLDIHLSMSDQGENDLLVSLPSLDIWLHLVDWTEVIDLLSSYPGRLAKNSIVGASPNNSLVGQVDQIENATVNAPASTSICVASENMMQTATTLAAKLENIGIEIHIPVWISREAFSIFGEPLVQEEGCHNDSCNMDEGVHNNFITVSFRNGSSELLFFSQVKVEAEIRGNQLDLAHSMPIYNVRVWICGFHITYSSSGKVWRSYFLKHGQWNSKGPLMEVLMRNFLWHANMVENKVEGSVAGDLRVNYNNIHKVLWEPFIEPWNFELNFSRLHAKSALLSNAIMTDFHLTSTAQLNLNITVSLVEAIFRATEMVKDAWGLMGHKSISESQSLLSPQICENMNTGRYAPYILQNLTSLPLVFQVCQGSIYADYVDMSFKGGTLVHPGSSVPIYVNDDETPEELLRSRPAHSSDRLGDKQVSGVAHHYIVIQFNGTSVPSTPISMDLVGLNHFEVDFSKSTDKMEVDKNREYSKSNKHADEVIQTDSKGGFVVPVVCDVSVQRYCKLIRLYSTVILCNATSMPFEVRFDIPFGVSPKILDPILPGREFPLPLHLAEAGRVRWRPLDQNYLWSEAHNISNILLQETKIGHFRSFVCYPSHPSSDPFRCCISVQQMCFPPAGNLERSSSRPNNSTLKPSIENCGQVSCNLDKSKKHFIHQVTLCCPLIVRNYLPKSISLTIESGGVARTALLSKVETSFFHIDSSHDLGIVLRMHGFKPSILKFPRAETFSGIAKFSGTKYSISETVTFEPDLTDGPVYVTVEKVMDAFSGAREIFIFVPYLLYNCTGFSLIVSDCTTDMKGHGCIIPSCYDMCEEELLLGRKDGLGLLSTPQGLQVESATDDGLRNSSSLVSTRKIMDPQTKMLFRKPLISGSSIMSQESSDRHDLDAHKAAVNSLKKRWCSSIQSHLECSNLAETECKKVEACMYSPDPSSSVTETMVRLSRYMPQCATEKMPKYCWSSPFFLVQPTGSTNVVIPQLSGDAAYIISVTSSAVDGPFSGRTRAITFQPRYVLSNACSKDLCYKQKGTDSIFHLATKQHSHLQWTETTRELLVSVRFNEPGWQWSGCFLADHLGDTQVKMRNYVSGAVNMIRVEVQNADISLQEEKIDGSVNGNSGTNLILLSDDDTGFMPYRIDNFSKERIRVYQQRCESFETLIQSYTSCSYAWDEPFYPHRLTVEVPGERVIGSYTLDDVKEYAPIYLPSTSEKPERTLLVSVHAEGAIKVLSIIDSSYHVLNDAKDPRVSLFKGKRKPYQKQESSVDFNEKISVSIPFIGISLIDSHPQNLDQQKFSFQISSFQIDNQLPSTPYPVILLCEPAFWLAAAKWRNRDVSLASFEYISLRLADFHLELEQEVILGLFDFFRTVSSRSRVGLLTFGHSTSHPVTSDLGFINESPSCTEAHVQPKGVPSNPTNGTQTLQNCISCPLLPSVVPIGAPWQQIFLLARRQKKVYVEMFDVAPIKMTLRLHFFAKNFSQGNSLLSRGLCESAADMTRLCWGVGGSWVLGSWLVCGGGSTVLGGGGLFVRWMPSMLLLFFAALVAAAQRWAVEFRRGVSNGVRALGGFRVSTGGGGRELGFWDGIEVFGSAGVIGNPMGFARSVGLGIKDFLSVPARSVFQSPAGLFTGMAQGTTSLLSNTVFAISDAATQFSRAAHKGIVAFTFDDQADEAKEKQQKGISSHSKGVINELLEGLTGLLQSPIKGAEKHGLPGVLSGVALGITGLVARPAASILEVTGKTAQSIRNRSKLHHVGPQRLRVRLPRPLSRELPLMPYSWEEAVGTSILAEAENGLKLKEEVLIMCKALKQGGKFVVITERLILIVSCLSLVDFGGPEFQGVPVDPEWVIEAEIGIDSIIHADTSAEVVHIVGSSSDPLLRQNQLKRGGGGARAKRWNNPPTTLPLYQTNLEFSCKEEAEELLRVLLSTIEKGKERGWGSVYLLHQSNLK
ncbi:hypothetical protein C3L33_06604, partial [Rhododendron williamsianum]